jgi:hypothetical protein
MATIIVKTALDFTQEEKRLFFTAIDEGAGPAFENHHSLLVDFQSAENYRSSVSGETFILVMNPPGETGPAVREKFTEDLTKALEKTFGKGGFGEAHIVFRCHEDDSVGVDGVIRADAIEKGEYL